MKNCFLELAGQIVELRTEHEMKIADNFIPFCIPQPTEKPAWIIETKSCKELPEMTSSGSYIDSRYLSSKEAPVTLTHIVCQGHIQIHHLEACAEWIADTRTIFSYIGIERFLLEQNKLMLHASFIKYKDMGILFSAPSGTGKSTQAELWQQVMNAKIINGDRAVLGKTEEGWMSWGSPYAGTSKIYINDKAKIKVLVILKQAAENQIQKISPSMAIRFLYPEISIHHWDETFVTRVMDLAQELLMEVPVYLLECLPNEAAVELLYQTIMKGEA